MGLLTRLSGVWSYVSPAKTSPQAEQQQPPAPQPSPERAIIPPSSQRLQRYNSRQVSSVGSGSVKRGRRTQRGQNKNNNYEHTPRREEMTPGRKRKLPSDSDSDSGPPSKRKRRAVEGIKEEEYYDDDDDADVDNEEDDGFDEEYDTYEEEDINGDVAGGQDDDLEPAEWGDEENEADVDEAADDEVEDDEVEGEDGQQLQEEFGEGDDSLVVTTEQYEYKQNRRRTINKLPANGNENGSVQDNLRSQGWDDDHIELYTHLARRGFEPILPHYFHFEYHWFMPDILFSDNDTDAIINSATPETLGRARKALDNLFEIGPSMRDATLSPNGTLPEHPFRQMLNAYIKWAARDSGLDPKTAIPLVIAQTASANTPVSELRQRAERRLAVLAARYRAALTAALSTEFTEDDIPTLYAFICRDTTVVLGAYRVTSGEDGGAEKAPAIKSVATLKFEEPEYDIYSAFAMAMTVCHCRNVQLRIAKDTGIGVRDAGAADDDEGDDPDA